ncbi:hypothetical protein HMPREF1987_00799 [Peptostreptococcaceae bacterium oral taxon 113 str. W5053]|nr:hypothetical protein HMPREF1987_00799 [Peptostreptococcaceae bacterium oral taxon 113 str. W5053]
MAKKNHHAKKREKSTKYTISKSKLSIGGAKNKTESKKLIKRFYSVDELSK